MIVDADDTTFLQYKLDNATIEAEFDGTEAINFATTMLLHWQSYGSKLYIDDLTSLTRCIAILSQEIDV